MAQRVEVRVTAETKALRAALAKAQRENDRFRRRTQSSMRRVSRAYSSVRTSVLGVAGAYVSLRGVSTLIRTIIENTTAQQRAVNQLSIALGRGNEELQRQIESWAELRQQQTAFGDESTIQAAAILRAYSDLDFSNLTGVLEFIQDLSALTGRSMERLARTIGSALVDVDYGITQLRTYGFQVNDSLREQVKLLIEAGKRQEALNLLLSAAPEGVKGQAEAYANTLGGLIEQIKNAFNDLFEGTDEQTRALRKSLKDIVELLTSDEFKQEASEAVEKLFGAMEKLTGSVKELILLLQILGIILPGVFAYKGAKGLSNIIREANQSIKKVRDAQKRAQISRSLQKPTPEQIQMGQLFNTPKLNAQIKDLNSNFVMLADRTKVANINMKVFSAKTLTKFAEILAGLVGGGLGAYYLGPSFGDQEPNPGGYGLMPPTTEIPLAYYEKPFPDTAPPQVSSNIEDLRHQLTQEREITSATMQGGDALERVRNEHEKINQIRALRGDMSETELQNAKLLVEQIHAERMAQEQAAAAQQQKEQMQQALSEKQSFIMASEHELRAQENLLAAYKLSGDEYEKLRTRMETLNRIRSSGVQLTQQEIDAELQRAEATRQLQLEFDKVTEQRQEWEQLGAGAKAAFSDMVSSAITGTQSIGDAFRTMAQRIIAQLIEVLIVQKLVNAAAGAFGGSSFFSSLGLAGAGAGAGAGGGTALPSGLVAAAQGGTFGAGDYALVGEQGPEIVRFGGRAQVYSNRESRRMAGGGEMVVNQYFNINVQDNEKLREEMSQVSFAAASQATQALMSQTRKDGEVRRIIRGGVGRA